MPPLLAFLIAYAGIGGKNVGKIDDQVHAVVAKQVEITEIDLSKKQRHALVTHAKNAERIVRELDVDGLITGEVERSKRGAKLTVVVYGSDGVMMDMIEVPLSKRAKKLDKSDLSTLRETLAPDIERMSAPPPTPEPVAQAEDDEVAKEVAATDGSDDEDPAGLTATTEVAVAPKRRRSEPLLRISAGAGMRTRTFAPGPADAVGYRSSAVPNGQVALEVRPIKYAAIAAQLDRTLTMSSKLESGQTPTSIVGWQATGALRLPLGTLELAALGGIGKRTFVIDSAEPAPTPDADYLHALLGGQVTAKVGAKLELRAFGAFEPVIGGVETMSPAGATRSGLAVGGSATYSATRHLFVLLDAAYQRFTTSWEDGSAVDEYPGANLSIGAQY